MLRKKAVGISVLAVTLMAASSFNFGALAGVTDCSADVVYAEGTDTGKEADKKDEAKEEAKILKEFTDPGFRKLVKAALEALMEGRAEIPADVTVDEGYTDPIYSTDIENLKKIVEISAEAPADDAEDADKIKSIGGVEYLEGLEKLSLPEQDIAEVNLEKNAALKKLNLSGNELKALKLEANTELTDLNAAENEIESIDLLKSTKLEAVDLSKNKLLTLDLSKSKPKDHAKVSGQTRTIEKKKTDGKFEVSLKELLGEDSFKLVEAVNEAEGVSYDKESGVVTLSGDADSFTYNINYGSPIKDSEDKDKDKNKEKDKDKEKDAVKPYLMDVTITVDELEDEHIHKKYAIGYGNGLIKPEGTLTRAEAAAIYSRLLADGDENVKLDDLDSDKDKDKDEKKDSETEKDKKSDDKTDEEKSEDKKEDKKDKEDKEDKKDSDKKVEYSDVSDEAWYKKYVDYVTAKGIMNGYPDGAFKPDAPITRAEITKMIASQLNVDGKETKFSDVKGHWALDSIKKAYEAGIVNGYLDGKFKPDDFLKRAEMAKMFNVLFDRGVNEEGLKSLKNPELMAKFDDLNPEHWAYYELVEATNDHKCVEVEGQRAEKWLEILESDSSPDKEDKTDDADKTDDSEKADESNGSDAE